MLIFHGAKGVAYEDITLFEYDKFEDPSWEPPYNPLMGPAVAPTLRFAHAKDYPVAWRHNDDGDLEVTITLPELRPYPERRSDDDDIVLVLRDVNLDEVKVTYKATAHGYGDVFEGEPITVPIEKVNMFESFQAAFEASKEAS